MQLPKIVQTGNIVLRRRAAEVAPEAIGSREMRDLVSTMVAVMRAAPGVGLAAPQIGVGLRVIVLEDREDLMGRLSPEDRAVRGRVPVPLRVIFNPVLTLIGEKRATFFEGCLSVSGFMALVERAYEVEVTGLDEKGKPVKWRVSGWPARILQHEVDHVEGSLYIDRMLTRSFCTNEEAPSWIGLPVDEVRETLKT
jgi:peptide deformylase